MPAITSPPERASPLAPSPTHPLLPIKTYIHPSPATTLLPVLTSSLPHTLPLVRRLQFHLQTPHSFAVATFPPQDQSQPQSQSQSPSSEPVQEPEPKQASAPNQAAPNPPKTFAAAWIDRSRAPETECWVYSSLERQANSANARSQRADITSKAWALENSFNEDSTVGKDSSPSWEQECHEARGQVLAVLEHVRSLGVPGEYPTDKDEKLLLVGALHRVVLELLKGGGVDGGVKVISDESGMKHAGAMGADPDQKAAEQEKEGSHVHGSLEEGNGNQRGVVRGHTVPYGKFVFQPATYVADAGEDVTQGKEGLPAGLQWTVVRREEFGLVLSRTDIPRKERTLANLPSVGIRVEGEGGEDGRLVAWGFLGADASLTSLHVEEEFRGRKLAQVLTARVLKLLCRNGGGLVGGELRRGLDEGIMYPAQSFRWVGKGTDYHHADVAGDNLASVGVAKALGGYPLWECFWTWIDLDAVRMKVARVE